MIDSGGTSMPPKRPADETRVRARIESAVRRARFVLLWEDLWPRIAPICALFGLFAAVSWLGLWRILASPARIAVVAAFLAALLFLALRAASSRRPGRIAALARIERASGALHRPATAFGDRLASAPNDPIAETLWIAHRQRLLASLKRLRSGPPRPGLVRRDPIALRFLVVLLFVVGFVFAGPERLERLKEAFRGGESTVAAIARIDAWVTPPPYTARAPIFLTGEAAKPPGTGYSVPAGSIVTVRIGGGRDLDVAASIERNETPVAATESAGAATPDRSSPLEHRITLTQATDVLIRKDGREIQSWRFAVEPDAAPRIAFRKPPRPTMSGALSFAYTLGDDYGVVSATAVVEAASLDSGEKTDARPLLPAPSVPLSLPQMRVRDGAGETIKDLTSHPWAGTKVSIVLVARDDAGQEGRSEPVEITLPARQFTDPVARAMVEQRTWLATDANNASRVADALDAITIAPQKGLKDLSAFLVVRSVYFRLLDARNDDALRDVVD